MKTLALVGLLSFTLSGCAMFAAIGALTIPEQVAVYGGMATGAAAIATAAVNADHACHEDGGCKAVPLPP